MIECEKCHEGEAIQVIDGYNVCYLCAIRMGTGEKLRIIHSTYGGKTLSQIKQDDTDEDEE